MQLLNLMSNKGLVPVTLYRIALSTGFCARVASSETGNARHEVLIDCVAMVPVLMLPPIRRTQNKDLPYKLPRERGTAGEAVGCSGSSFLELS